MAGAKGEQFEPGLVFTYRGPRQWFQLKAPLAVGKIIGSEPDGRIVHVRTYFDAASDEDTPAVAIGHIPMVSEELISSMYELRGVGSVDADCWESINEWRRRSASGGVGAFSLPLWKAEQLVRAVLPPEAKHHAVRYGFPKRGRDGAFSVVEAAVYDG